MNNPTGLSLVKHIRDIYRNEERNIPFGDAPPEQQYVVFYFYVVESLHRTVNSNPDESLLKQLIVAEINNNTIDATIKLAFSQAHG